MDEPAHTMTEPRELTEQIKQDIRTTQEQVRLKMAGYRPRASQARMIATVARNLAKDSGAAAIEAGTGTGKSIAYLIAAVPIARAQAKKLIISTGTIALQEQLTARDIPNFLAHSGIAASVVLAKGRQRYLCPSKLYQLIAEDSQSTLNFDEEPLTAAWERPPKPGEVATLKRAAETFESGAWDGDIDGAPVTITDALRTLVTTTAGGCANRRCPHVGKCPFYRARSALDQADIIVANHDLVLSDLALSSGEDEGNGGVLLPKPSDSLYVIDEGHMLPAKAIERGRAEFRFAGTRNRLRKLKAQAGAAYGLAGKVVIGKLTLERGRALVDAYEADIEAMEGEISTAWTPDPKESEPQWRASLGQIPDAWRQRAIGLADQSMRLLIWTEAMRRAVLEAEQGAKVSETLAREVGMAKERTGKQCQLWRLWSRVDAQEAMPTARWVTLTKEGGLVAQASAVNAAGFLRKTLWGQAAGAVITSATLTSGGDFRAFAAAVGLPDHAQREHLPSPFDMARQGELVIPAIRAQPADRDAHVKAIVDWISGGLDWTAGNLVLFTSKEKMRLTLEALTPEHRAQVRAQGAQAKSALLAEHVQAIESGRGSTLFGLASFGEGLSLEGALCSTVVITQIPFAVPTEPVSATYAEWLEANRRNAFMEVTVPEATRTLVQYAGRLIRGETDTGRVVVLDRRIVEKRYGAAMLDALPPFTRRIERPARAA